MVTGMENIFKYSDKGDVEQHFNANSIQIGGKTSEIFRLIGHRWNAAKLADLSTPSAGQIDSDVKASWQVDDE